VKRPFYVYDNWSTYDELSDAVPLTEELALFQLEQVRRFMASGVKFDAYLMDAYWYDPSSAYRKWRPDRWPEGPDRWLRECDEAGLQPGLWFPANTAFELNVPDSWKDSLAADGWGFCCFYGGFLDGFIEVLAHWYGQGIRVFKLDFADFGAAPDPVRLAHLPSEIRALNIAAYRRALMEFKSTYPDAIFLGFNGFEEVEYMPWTDRPVRRTIDPLWLDVFETIYSGDPRPSDQPLPDFWRSVDLYSDHVVRYLNLGGIPLDRIDNCALMLGRTGTCYRRGSSGWLTAWLLSLARGGRVHVAMGNLEDIPQEALSTIAQLQLVFAEAGCPEWIGGLPGKGEWFGYRTPLLQTIVNPSIESVRLTSSQSLCYADGASRIDETTVLIGPGGVALFGDCPPIGSPWRPLSPLIPLEAQWVIDGRKAGVTVKVDAGHLIFGFKQLDSKGQAVRSTTGSGPDTPSLGTVLQLAAFIGEMPVEIAHIHERVIWSGISWALGLVTVEKPSEIRLEMLTTDGQVNSILPFAYYQS
jgi:hypothetical protein